MNSLKKILVVDDDNDILSFLQALLEDEGYAVEVMDNGENAGSISGDLPQLIILDVLLSGMDGRDVARKLKSNGQTSTIPIIMFSAHPGASESVRACGADAFLPKPFEIDDLLSLVEQYI